MKSKIQSYLKHRFPLMTDSLVEDISAELEAELSEQDQDGEKPTTEEFKKIMDGEGESAGPSIDLGIKKPE